MEKIIIDIIKEGIGKLYKSDPDNSEIQLQDTRKDFNGDITLVVFPLLRYSGKSPEQTANDIGKYLVDNCPIVAEFNIVKGFLNIVINDSTWINEFNVLYRSAGTAGIRSADNPKTILLEYSSPNTNKPLHLGHIRNNLLGYSLYRILGSRGHKVFKTNIVNDRGIHICKSMLAWKLFGNNEKPDDLGIKGDHFVGKYYVKFESELQKELKKFTERGFTEDEAIKNSELMEAARDLLRKWESGEKETVDLWMKMNNWVYDGFDITYRRLGVDFDKIYYESDTYKLGRTIIDEGLEKAVFEKRDDGSVWIDLSDEGLDDKLLLRADGTAVYMTQDLGTAVQRYNDFHFDNHYYVVGNEQNYHFQVLKHVLSRLGYEWADGLHHFSYGMVNLPEGKMKSREGKVVDADDLIDEMISTARDMSEELGKLHDYPDDEKAEIHRKVGLGALKYFILKVDPRKNMLFNPRESIDFNGNTGPFIQYTYARIKSVLRKADEKGITVKNVKKLEEINDKEKDLLKLLRKFDAIIDEAAVTMNPSVIANYSYDLSKEYNQFYHDHSILGNEDDDIKSFRLALSDYTAKVIMQAMWLMGIEMPGRM